MNESREGYDSESAILGPDLKKQGELNEARCDQLGGEETSPETRNTLTKLGGEEEEIRQGKHLEPLNSSETDRMRELQKKQTESTDWGGQDAKELIELQERFQSKGEVSPQKKAA